MGSNQSNVMTSKQQVVNNMYQESSQECNITCENIQSGNTIEIIDSEINGTVGFIQTCTLDSPSCIMKTTLDTNVSTILDAMLKQTSSAPSGLSLSFNNSNQRINLEQYIENSITQIQSTSCDLLSKNEMVNNAIFVKNSTVNGDVIFEQTGGINNANCNMDNMAKAVVANEISSDITQESKIMSMGQWIIIAIILCALIGGVVMIARLFAQPSDKKDKSQNSGQGATPQIPTG